MRGLFLQPHAAWTAASVTPTAASFAELIKQSARVKQGA
jgi:hypothetical protein